MIRSLSFIQLFVILTVGYTGGVLLYRSIPSADFTLLVQLYDQRAVSGGGSPLLFQLLSVLSFYILAAALALSSRTKWLVMMAGALKSVLFGLSSAYLLADGLKMTVYAAWWFPFQLAATLLVFFCCWTLSPPFYLKQPKKKKFSWRVPVLFAAAGVIVFFADKIVYKLTGG